MKTTVDLPDELVIEAKKRAVEDRTTLRALLERGLRRELERPVRGLVRGRRLRLPTVAGALAEGLDLADRAGMHDWLQRRR